MKKTRPAPRPGLGGVRGRPELRLRVGFIVIAMVLSVFGARLVQMQGLDPKAIAARAAQEGTVEVTLPAQRGDIVDRNGTPLADSVTGKMVVADPSRTRDVAPELATLLSTELDVDYFSTLKALRVSDRRWSAVARRVPSTKAADVLEKVEEAGFTGVTTEPDPVRSYPAKDVAANLVGFIGTDEALGGLERTFNTYLAGKDGSSSYQVGSGYRIPTGESTVVKARDGKTLTTTLDRDLQWFAQRELGEAVDAAGADSGSLVVLDSRTSEVLTVADYPSYDASDPLLADKEDLGARSLTDAYEPGSVAKVLTFASLIDAGKITPRTPFKVPAKLMRQDRPIGDWFDHDTIKLTATGVLAKSSNIGTVLAADKFSTQEMWDYFDAFGLGHRTDIGVRGETRGIFPPASAISSQSKDRMVFGQSMSVNALQMAAAVNTIANGGVHVDPSLIRGSATTEDGTVVGTDQATTRRVVSTKAARQTARMMERVTHEGAGVAPAAQVPGYRVAGKTGTAQRVDAECQCYRGTSLSFGGFAPADDPRFTVYVVIHNPSNGGGGGSTAGPVFSRVLGYALSRYRVPPTGTKPSKLPVEW